MFSLSRKNLSFTTLLILLLFLSLMVLSVNSGLIGTVRTETNSKKPTIIRVIPSIFTIELAAGKNINAKLIADIDFWYKLEGQGPEMVEQEHLLRWSVEKGRVSSETTPNVGRHGQGITYYAPDYETTDTLTVSFSGNDEYQSAECVVTIKVTNNLPKSTIYGIDTEFWETVSPNNPQFLITIFNKDKYDFTITKVVLDGVEVWNGRLIVSAESTTDLEISDISEVTELKLNLLNEVFVENALTQPAYYHNVVISGDPPSTNDYPEGHAGAHGYLNLINPDLDEADTESGLATSETPLITNEVAIIAAIAVASAIGGVSFWILKRK